MPGSDPDERPAGEEAIDPERRGWVPDEEETEDVETVAEIDEDEVEGEEEEKVVEEEEEEEEEADKDKGEVAEPSRLEEGGKDERPRAGG